MIKVKGHWMHTKKLSIYLSNFSSTIQKRIVQMCFNFLFIEGVSKTWNPTPAAPYGQNFQLLILKIELCV